MTAPSTTSPGRDVRGFCIIMAGGRGTRFWPLSRTARPKQLQALAGERSLLRETFERVVPLVGPDRVLVVTSGPQGAATRAELPELASDRIIVEPVGRNTAPCAVLGMGLAGRLAPEAPVALLPADHAIPDADTFRTQLARAFALAAADRTVVTFGIAPDRAETGYGYLETADVAGDVREGVAFVEKPDLATAGEYVRSGRHFWNSGMFVWHPDHFRAEAEAHVPDVVRRLAPAVAAQGTESFAAALEDAYRDCPADSIDFAVMEKLARFRVLPAAFRWSDLGSWDAWAASAAALDGTNRGRADLLAIDATGNIVRGERRLVALLGVDDLIIIDTDDALLVCRKADAQRIKEVIARLETEGRDELL
ncbi:mannose-1-phosphate guanylyltransferase [bacterium]|nr:mannose-1-phosphate guanylyltransferase [bacterium]